MPRVRRRGPDSALITCAPCDAALQSADHGHAPVFANIGDKGNRGLHEKRWFIVENTGGSSGADALTGTGPRPALAPMKRLLIPAARQGVAAFWDLAKVIAPIYLAVSLLDYTGLVALFARSLSPVMRIFGLPGEAAVALLTGWFLTLYGALGALKALDLNSSAITTVGLMLLICHAIPMEWAILHKMGARAARITIIRFLVCLLAGAACALVYRGQPSGLHLPAHAAASTQVVPLPLFLGKSALGCAKLLALVLVIIVPVTMISEWMRDREILPRAARRLAVAKGRFGATEGTLVPLLIGLIFGIVYGGGALIALARAKAVKPEEARIVGLFLGLCHSLIEDPILFIAVGGNWLWLLPGRCLIAIILTPIVRRWVK